MARDPDPVGAPVPRTAPLQIEESGGASLFEKQMQVLRLR